MSIYEKLSEININGKTEKKGKFTYLSWAFAWGELMKIAPDSTSKVYHDENTNMPYFSSNAGVLVKVGVTVGGLEHINYLPVMNFRNEAIKPDVVTMMDVNKTIQRCTTKAIALHGLGLYIYAGEDLPEPPKPEPLDVSGQEKEMKTLKTKAELGEYWKTLNPVQKTALTLLKDKLKLELV